MTTIRDFTYAWGDLHNAVIAGKDAEFIAADESKKYLVRLYRMIPDLIDTLEASIKNVVVITATAPPLAAPVQAPDVVTAQVVVVPARTDATYDEFAELCERYGRNVADSLRVWFKDVVGGYDASSAAERVDLFSKMSNYFAEKATEKSAPGIAPSSERKPFVARSGGDAPKKRRVGPCPDCTLAGEETRVVRTKYGEKYRCDEHDWWGNA